MTPHRGTTDQEKQMGNTAKAAIQAAVESAFATFTDADVQNLVKSPYRELRGIAG
jgi:hypothetical protein